MCLIYSYHPGELLCHCAPSPDTSSICSNYSDTIKVDVWSDKKRQNQERTHPRNDESSAGVQKDNGEKTGIVWAGHEDGRRSRSEESDDESDTGEKEERETKDNVEGCVQEGHADCRTERGR